jgi:hypothetical protein
MYASYTTIFFTRESLSHHRSLADLVIMNSSHSVRSRFRYSETSQISLPHFSLPIRLFLPFHPCAYLLDFSFSRNSNNSASVISLKGVWALLLVFFPVALPLVPTPKEPELYSPDAGTGVVASSTLSARAERGSDEDAGWEARN